MEPPARIPVPVSNPLYVLSSPSLSVQLPFLQESCIVQIWQREEEDSSYHSCEELLLVVPPLSFSSSFQEPSSGIPSSNFLVGILKVFLVGRAADGCSGADTEGSRQENGGGGAAGDPGFSRDRGLHGYAYLGEHWGGTHLGEHWGPARERYLRGPWVPHPEELDRCVILFL